MESYLKEQLDRVLATLNWPEIAYQFDRPRVEAHGDLSVNLAMPLAREIKQNPRQIAQTIVEHLELNPDWIEKVEIAGPGFINFFFSPTVLQQAVRDILERGEQYGRFQDAKGKKAQVEFVSANPTGPLTVGHGRQAVLGDTIANLLEWMGYEVQREYYFNNAGRQMRILADSVRLRYLELLGETIEFPQDYYQGEYIREIARHLYETHGDALKDETNLDIFKETAEKLIFEDIKKTLARLGIVFDSFYNELDLYTNGEIDRVVQIFKEKGLAYEKDGALWFKSTAFGLEQDRVIIKSSGEPTYRLPDIAYHKTKFDRGFDLIVDLFGADHIATYPDVLAGLKALGYDTSRVKVLIHQFVTLFEGKEKVKMSTRKANFVTLDELIDEVGADVTRWFFLMRSMQSHLNFDLTLAKTHSDENPVYYNQYAHARICSILRTAEEKGIRFEQMDAFHRLGEKSELDLIKKLIEFPKLVRNCARDFEPHLLTQYLSEVSTAFHKFYTECWVIGDDAELTQARLGLCLATSTVLANGFRIVGVSAPERM
ncbi:MAG: arginine--tRNA ligase [Calditrichaeota bacterium]|nr:arginine--tRNA ligase [Calditrichota bacterium]